MAIHLHNASVCRSILGRLFAFSVICLAGAGVCQGKPRSGDRLIAECEESMVRADYHKAERLSRQLMAYGERIDSDRCRSFANAYMGSFYVARGRLEEGLRMLDKARVWAEEEHNDTVQAISLNGLGIYYVMAENNLVIALKYFNEAKTYAVKASLPPLRFRIESNVVQTAIIRNDTTMLDYAITRVRDNESPNGCSEKRHRLSGDPVGSPDFLPSCLPPEDELPA